MTTVVLDTNVLLRLAHPAAPEHALCQGAIVQLVRQDCAPAIVAQVVVEFWAVATRPVNVNGLAWSASVTRAKLEGVLSSVAVLPEPPGALRGWLDLVTNMPALGKRVHDVRIAATMLGNGVRHLLTFNGTDFANIPGIVPLHPSTPEIP